MTTTPKRVVSTDGVSLAVYEAGDPGCPTLLALHGYPDNHSVWDGMVGQLADRFHVVTYDVRGTGASDKPSGRSAYRLPQLLDDLAAVLDAVSPAVPVHLLGHDWGSVQLWAAVTDDRLRDRFASFTSISGPSLDYSAAWLRQMRKHPRASLGQLAHSYYIMLFQLPRLPEVMIRSGLFDRGLRRARSAAAVGTEPVRSEADKVNGLSLYRANIFARMSRPRPVPTALPVQVVVPDRDPFVTSRLAVEAARPWADNLTVHEISGGHWVVSEQPDEITRLVAGFVDSIRAPDR